MENANVPASRCTTVRRAEDALSTEVDGEVICMSVSRASYVGFDDVGSDVWRLIEQPIAIEALVARLAESYDGEPAVIEQDVRNLLSEMAKDGLVVLS